MKITTKLVFLFFVFVTVPMGGMLILLHDKWIEAALMCAVFGVALSLAFLVPLAHLVGHFLILKDLKELNELCSEVRSGNYNVAFMLPPEAEEEHAVLQLKRNMNWMVHAIACREAWHQSRLNEIAEHKRRFEALSMRDGLTGVYNRRFFEEALSERCETARRRGEAFYLMYLDCDGFKAVNDTYGHEAGDALLCRLGKILKASLRGATDCPFRYGGDEFGALLGDIGLSCVREVAERIRKRFMEECVEGATLSIGIARYHALGSQEKSIKRIRKDADGALYRAKRSGKNCVVVAPTDG